MCDHPDRTHDDRYTRKGRLRSSVYVAEMERLQEQLVRGSRAW